MRFPAICLAALLVGCGGSDADAQDQTGADTETETAGETASTGDEFRCLEQVAECPAAPGYLTPDLVAANVGLNLRLIDVRGPNEFEAGHLPGAVQLDPASLRATVDGVSGQVAPEADVRAAWESLGLTPTDLIVVYGADNGTDPARVVWTLMYYGHQGSVWSMDGGFSAWTGEVETGSATVTPTTYATQIVPELREDRNSVLAGLDDGARVLFDARTPEEFAAGHIPGAVNVDWTTNLAAGGQLKTQPELQALYGPPEATSTLVTYCQTGSRASVDWLVLRSLGFEDVRLYDGSWAEWSSDPDNPVE